MVEERRTIILGTNVFEAVKKDGDELRKELKKKKLFLVNVMSGPGAGKTTTLISLIQKLKNEFRIGVVEADMDSDVDAVKVSKETGVPSLQVHTDSLCYIDVDMVRESLAHFEEMSLDCLFLENIGNMVCPSTFDTGACLNVCILSLPDGDEKPFNYPSMFEGSDLILINKIDTLEFFPFDFQKVEKFIHGINPQATIIPYSAKSGEGVEKIVNYLSLKIQDWRK